jgi:hypothetical protein
MNLDNFLLTPEEATNLANDLIQQQAYKSGVSLSEPAFVVPIDILAIYDVAVLVVVAAIVAVAAAVEYWVWCFTQVSSC